MHQMMRSTACGHQREAEAKAGPAAIPVKARGFPGCQHAKARIGQTDRQIAEADEERGHDEPAALLPMGAPICSRNSSMK